MVDVPESAGAAVSSTVSVGPVLCAAVPLGQVYETASVHAPLTVKGDPAGTVAPPQPTQSSAASAE
jgi:hypothetical protein